MLSVAWNQPHPQTDTADISISPIFHFLKTTFQTFKIVSSMSFDRNRIERCHSVLCGAVRMDPNLILSCGKVQIPIADFRKLSKFKTGQSNTVNHVQLVNPSGSFKRRFVYRVYALTSDVCIRAPVAIGVWHVFLALGG